MEEIDFAGIEKKWQDRWAAEGVFEAKTPGAGSREPGAGKGPYYVLEMFAYPSGEGLHMGHAFNFVIGDVIARFKMMQGFNVLHPVGYDSLGLPAENAAIKVGTHPADYTNTNIPNFMKQQKGLGLSYDWSRMVSTASPDYYKWDQWIFLKMLEKGLAYQKVSAVNWCSKCNTVLANEQAQSGSCDLCGTKVEMKQLKQWFFRITDYADELYSNLDNMNWPEKTKAMQRNWIGKSHGTEIDFLIENQSGVSGFRGFGVSDELGGKGEGENGSRIHADSRGLGIGNVVIVHGCPGDEEKSLNPETRTYDKHWIPWIRKNLKESEIAVEVPMMPVPWKARYDDWKKEFDKKVDVNENSVLIGHSCGCSFLVRWLREAKKKVKKLILVAPWKIAESGGAEKGFYDYEIDKDIGKRVGNIVIFSSDDEEEDGKKSAVIFRDALGCKIVELKEHGHFTQGDMGTEEFPELLDEIIEPRTLADSRGQGKVWKIFTTRSDTIFGVTFMVVSAQHSRLDELVIEEQRGKVEKFLSRINSVSEKDVSNLEKEGVFSGSYAVNPATGERVPVWIGNFVVADYGAGMVMAVPAHDARDFEFAKKYGISIKEVVADEENGTQINTDKHRLDEAFTGVGKLINSGEFDGLDSVEAKEKISDWLIEKGVGRRVVNFKLRDWGISRQRYWGTPIPVVHCSECGVVPVAEKDLPVRLPKEVKFGEGNPLESAEDWLNVKCPKCGGEARRESDTMDTFVNSSWYMMRFCDAHNDKEIFDKAKVKYWCPVDFYVGGAEHACMHLIYSRFYVKFLRDLGLIDFDEPAVRLFHQGMINDEKGEKMSKSKGNVVEPLETMAKYGVDTTRYFLLSMAAPDKGFNWSDKEIAGSQRFVRKVYEFFASNEVKDMGDGFEDSAEVLSRVNLAIRDVGEGIEKMELRAVTIKLKELFNFLGKQDRVSKESREKALKLLVPFCPHVCEELFEVLRGNRKQVIGNRDFVSLASWSKVDESKIGVRRKELGVSLNEGVIERIKKVVSDNTEAVYVYAMPFEVSKIDGSKISEEVGKKVTVFSVSNSEKIDPENVAKRAKPGKPAIYVCK